VFARCVHGKVVRRTGHSRGIRTGGPRSLAVHGSQAAALGLPPNFRPRFAAGSASSQSSCQRALMNRAAGGNNYEAS